MHHARRGTPEQSIFLHFFSVPELWCERGAKKQRPGTPEHGKTFKIIKEYTPRSRSRPPVTPPRRLPLSVRPEFQVTQPPGRGVTGSLAWLLACPLALNRGPGIPWSRLMYGETVIIT